MDIIFIIIIIIKQDGLPVFLYGCDSKTPILEGKCYTILDDLCSFVDFSEGQAKLKAREELEMEDHTCQWFSCV